GLVFDLRYATQRQHTPLRAAALDRGRRPSRVLLPPPERQRLRRRVGPRTDWRRPDGGGRVCPGGRGGGQHRQRGLLRPDHVGHDDRADRRLVRCSLRRASIGV
ncbi:MAG: hypothetical protein AVDCRST_MAG75-327, partial [uncultured Propionibacteriaceae bacterium]